MINVNILEQETIDVGVTKESNISVGIGTIEIAINNPVNYYTGDYEVTPKDYPVTLPTLNKTMTDDVRVKKVTFFKTSNPDGNGDTIYIGG